MERPKVEEKSSNMFIVNSLLYLLLITIVSANEPEETSGIGRPVWNVDRSTGEHPTWNADSVVVKIGSNLTLSCVVEVVDLQYEVLRVSLIQGDVLFPLVENGLVHSPFSSIPRYSATLKEDRRSGGARITIHVEDIQPEDGGTYLCNKYSERDNSAVLNVTVLAPISDLYITSMYPDGDEFRLDSDSEAFLQEHDFYGVGCVATVEGRQTPPEVRVEIDGRDEMDSFQAVHQVDALILQSGLTMWNSHLRLALVSATPNPDYNEKQMRCIASQTGFPEVEVSTRLVVQYAPRIACIPERLVARQGTSATLDCNIRANPGSRIMWSSARGDLSNYPNVFFDETIISSDETRLTLSIRNIRPINFQRYTLTAANIVSSSRATFELVEDKTVAVIAQPEVDSFLPDKEGILPEVVEEVFPGGNDDFPAMDTDLAMANTSFAPESSSTFPEATSTTPEAISTLADGLITEVPVTSTLSEVKSTLPPVKSSASKAKSMLKDDKDTLPDAKNTLPDIKHTSPDAKNILPDTKDTVLGAKSTLPPVKITSPDVKSSTLKTGINFHEHTAVLPHEDRLSPKDKPHSSPARTRSAHHKGNKIPLKATMDALPVAATVPTSKTSLATTEEVEQPLPAAGEVHYSLSRSSSSSKKDSGKSSKTNKSTSGAGATTTVHYLLASSLLIRWL